MLRRPVERAVAALSHAAVGTSAIRVEIQTLENGKAGAVFFHPEHRANTGVATGRCRPVERAIAAFQSDRKLNANGRITSELLEEIKSVTGRYLESGAPRP